MIDSNRLDLLGATPAAEPEPPLAVTIRSGQGELDGLLYLPCVARGVIVFVHGSGSSWKSPRNGWVPNALRRRGLTTLLFDALTPAERQRDPLDQRLRFDIGFLARRLVLVTDWLRQQPFASSLPMGYFSTGAATAAAVVAAAEHPSRVQALVCRNGRLDLAGTALRRLRTPTLLLLDSDDRRTLDVNERAMADMLPSTQRVVVPHAGPRFDEAGALATVSQVAGDWFVQRFTSSAAAPPRLREC